MASFLGEIKRRKVFQVAAVYAVVAWLTIQIVDVIGVTLGDGHVSERLRQNHQFCDHGSSAVPCKSTRRTTFAFISLW